jgi:hypothetical protein
MSKNKPEQPRRAFSKERVGKMVFSGVLRAASKLTWNIRERLCYVIDKLRE